MQIRFGIWEDMLPQSEKHFQNIKKNLYFFYHVRLDILCARSRFHGKPTFFVSCIKKTKNILCNANFSTKIYLFYTQQKNIVFS
jgi:hypothetical protein